MVTNASPAETSLDTRHESSDQTPPRRPGGGERLSQLRTELAATPLSADLRLLPEATLNWLCRYLDLSEHRQQCQRD